MLCLVVNGKVLLPLAALTAVRKKLRNFSIIYWKNTCQLLALPLPCYKSEIRNMMEKLLLLGGLMCQFLNHKRTIKEHNDV